MAGGDGRGAAAAGGCRAVRPSPPVGLGPARDGRTAEGGGSAGEAGWGRGTGWGPGEVPTRGTGWGPCGEAAEALIVDPRRFS